MLSNKVKGITIYDIAEELNLSPSTVSRALKDHHSIGKKTKNLVRKFAEEKGYRPNAIAASLRNNKTNTIGVIMPRINRPFNSSLISGIEQVANEAGFNIIISQSHDNYEDEVKDALTLFASRVEGLIVSLCMESKGYTHFDQFLQNNIPIVLVDRVSDQLNSDMVMIDNYKAGFEATEHLIQQGCKRIAHVTGSTHSNLYAERFRGYKEALTKYNISLDESLVIHNSLSADDGHDAANSLFDRPDRPDGIFVTNDTAAVSIIQNAKSRNIAIPDDVAIIGFNDDPIATIITPALSTISHPAVDMGKIAAQQILKKKENTNKIIASEKLTLATELIPRASSLRKK